MRKRVFYSALFILTFFILWLVISRYYHSPLFPGPAPTLRAFFSILTSRDGWYHIGVTTYRVLAGLLLGSCIGFVCGILPRYSKVAEYAIRSVVYPLFESVPAICWALIFIVWFGLSDTTPILVVSASVLPFFMINLWEGINEIDESLIEMGMTYTRDRLRIMWKIILPMLYPFTFSAFKTSFEVAWKVVILGELFGAASGIGYRLWIAHEVHAMEYVLAWTLCCAAIIIIFDYGILNYIDKKHMRKWKR